jgi:hypothetical protein
VEQITFFVHVEAHTLVEAVEARDHLIAAKDELRRVLVRWVLVAVHALPAVIEMEYANKLSTNKLLYLAVQVLLL